MRLICENYNLHQLVTEPTREQYLLDLYLTDIAGSVVIMGSKIADHKMVIADISLLEPQALTIKRKRFDTRRANWKDLKKELVSYDWSSLQKGTAEEASKFFMESLWVILCSHIPYKEIQVKKQSHPWLNEACEKAIED